MNKTTNSRGRICTHEEFEQFKSFHELFKQYVKAADLSSEQFQKLSNHINDLEKAIVPTAKKVGIDLSQDIDTVREMWEHPELTHPEVTCAGWSGDRVEEAVDSVCCEYEAKLQSRKAAITDLDEVMVALYASQPKDMDHGPIFNIQDSNVVFGHVQQSGNLQVDDGARIQEQTEANDKDKGIFKKLLKITCGAVGFLAALFTCLYYLGWLNPIKTFIYNMLLRR